jgi:hypothetical protein
MASGNRESRFDELRRKAQERLREVRDNIRRGLELPETETAPPDRSEDMFTPVERQRPPEVPQERAPLQEIDRSADAWEQRVVVPSHQDDETAAAFEAPRIGPTIAATSTTVDRDVHRIQPPGASRTRLSPAAQLLKRGNLRQAIIAQEVLGKPLSMRPPQDEES